MQNMNIQLTMLVFALVVFGLSCGEREIEVDKLKLREDGLFYAENEDKPYSGKVTDFYIVYDGLNIKSKKKKAEIVLKNGQASGLAREWYDNGQVKNEGEYKEGKSHGLWTYWRENGQKSDEITFKDGIYDGRRAHWYENGQKGQEGVFKDGKMVGEWHYWSRDGQKRETGEVTDIDGNTYRTIKIGDQWWMAENLKVTHYRNGDEIPNITDDKAWAGLTTGALCSYDNDPQFKPAYGLLYNWYAVADERNIAPEGWHVPSNAEWEKLNAYVSDPANGFVEEGRWKADGNSGWPRGTSITNETGFSALLSAGRRSDGAFNRGRARAFFWTSTSSLFKPRPGTGAYAYDKNPRTMAYIRQLYYQTSRLEPGVSMSSGLDLVLRSKGFGASVRCVKD